MGEKWFRRRKNEFIRLSQKTHTVAECSVGSATKTKVTVLKCATNGRSNALCNRRARTVRENSRLLAASSSSASRTGYIERPGCTGDASGPESFRRVQSTTLRVCTDTTLADSQVCSWLPGGHRSAETRACIIVYSPPVHY